MSKWLGIVCVVACFGMGCGDDDVPANDAGPVQMDVPVVETDVPVVETDSGPIVETDTGPVGACDFDGTYTVEADAENPALCGAAAIESCELVTADGISTVTCMITGMEPVSGECEYDAACVCTGMTEVASFETTIAGDFPNMTLTATVATPGDPTVCNFTLAAL